MKKIKLTLNNLRKQWDLQLLVVPVIIWLGIFSYIPMIGLQIAFKDFSFSKGFFGSEWVGLRHFAEIVNDPLMRRAVYNTVCISLLRLVLLFPAPVIFALVLNEAKEGYFKRTVQTISYFPHFIAWAVVAMMVQQWLSPSSGFVNEALARLGLLSEPYHFLGKKEAFWWVVLGLEFWKNTGYGAIIYLATISGIDQEQYEAAYIDGANRFQRLRYITVPCIMGTIMIMFILNISYIINGNFDVSFLLGNTANFETSEILQTYNYKIGIKLGRFSYGTAVGMASGLISMVLLLTSNKIANKITDHSLF